MPKLVVIPDKTPDLRTCITMRWGAGVDLQVSTLRLRPASVARDGNDGAFALTTEINTQNLEIALRLHHVDAAGVPVPAKTLSTFSNVWFYEAIVVPSRTGTCIVVWATAGWGGRIQAQRFDSNLNPLWSAPVTLSPETRGFATVGVASDADGGAIVAFTENVSDGPSAESFRVQRVLANGSLPWGANGTSLVAHGSSSEYPFAPPQVVVGPNECAVVWEGWNSGPGAAIVFGAWLELNGSVINGPFQIGTTLDRIGLSESWVAPDLGGGFYVLSLPATTPLEILHFEGRALTPKWTRTTQTPAASGTYTVVPDGYGGALLATLGTTGRVTLANFDYYGTNVWASAAASNVATVTLLNTPPLPGQRLMAGSLALAARRTGGAVLLYSDWQTPTNVRLKRQCFDALGAFVGTAGDVSPTAGPQALPLLADDVLPSFQLTFPVKLTPRPDPESLSVVGIWQGRSGVNGTSVTAQKLGCCKRRVTGTVIVVPELEYKVPIGWPPTLPGTLNVIFPGGAPKGTMGVLPVPDLAEMPGANLPGGLASNNVPAPGWVRMWFDNVPAKVGIELRSHKDQVVAAATLLETPTSVERLRGSTMSLTFRPNSKLSYALVFTRTADTAGSPVVPIGLRTEFGAGKPPSLEMPPLGPRPRGRARAKSPRRASRAKASRPKARTRRRK